MDTANPMMKEFLKPFTFTDDLLKAFGELLQRALPEYVVDDEQVCTWGFMVVHPSDPSLREDVEQNGVYVGLDDWATLDQPINVAWVGDGCGHGDSLYVEDRSVFDDPHKGDPTRPEVISRCAALARMFFKEHGL